MFIVRIGSLIMEGVQTILSNVLLAFQLLLGLWQIGNLTPVGGLVKGGMGWLLSLLPFRLSPDYALLQHLPDLPGRVFKKVRCAVLTKTPALHDELITVPIKSEDISEIINVSHLGDDYKVERRDGNKLFVNGKMTHYITHPIWQILQKMAHNEGEKDWVCVKGYKRFWESMVTGGVMTFSDMLDSIILENQTVMLSDNVWLLPVNLTLSEEKVLKLLNLVGLFLQTKKVFWLIPTLFSFVSAVLEFNTRVRERLYRTINKVFCSSMQLICDKLSYSKRRQLYSLGNWVENLTPCNDIELRVVRGDVCAVIAGCAKANKEAAVLVPWLNVEGESEKTFHCDLPLVMWCKVADGVRCGVAVKYFAFAGDGDGDGDGDVKSLVVVNCKSSEDFKKMCTMVDCMTKQRSGSLKSYDGHNKVEVRGWRESVQHYAKSGYPDIYELNLEHVMVNSI